MGRWSPTVVAEAPPPRRSALSVALETGVDMYDRLKTRRQQQQRIDMEEARLKEDQDWRELQAGRWEREGKIADFQRGVAMTQGGWSTTDPGADSEGGELPPLAGPRASAAPQPSALGAMLSTPSILGGMPGTLGAPAPDADPSRRAANTAPGAAESEAIPRWYAAEKQSIAERARAMFPGSGVVTQRDPVTGQAYYLPVRRQWVDAQMAQLDARLRAERDAAAKAKLDREKFDYEQQSKLDSTLKEIAARNAGALAVARLRGRGGGGTDDEDDDGLDRDYGREMGALDKQIDDQRSGISAAGTRSSMADRAADAATAVSALGEANQRSRELAMLEERRARMAKEGPAGYRRSRADQELGAAGSQLSAEFAPIFNNPNVPPNVKEAARQKYQQAMDAIATGNRKKFKVLSPLGQAMR